VATVLDPAHETALRAAFEQLCSAAKVPVDDARLIRFTMNAVWAVDRHQLVVRMTPGRDAAATTARLVVTAQLLHLAGAPIAPLADIAQPIHMQGWSATIWRQLPPLTGPTTHPTMLATPLRELHAAPVPLEELPSWDIVGKTEKRIAKVSEATGEARLFLEQIALRDVGLPLGKLIDVLCAKVASVRLGLRQPSWILPIGVLHGDAHTGNLLRRGSQVVWCDLDSVCVGPPEWDLIPAAFGPKRFGRNRADYDRFAAAYGFDVTASPMWPVLAELREVQAVTSVLPNLYGRPMLAHEVGRRLRSIIHGEAVTWNRYE